MISEFKTYTEIKLRKLSDNQFGQLAAIMNHYKEVSAAGGLKAYIEDFYSIMKTINEQSEEIKELKATVKGLNSNKLTSDRKLKEIKDSYKVFQQLIGTMGDNTL